MNLIDLSRRLLSAVLLLICLASIKPAWCGTFTVNPVRIQVSASRPNAILQVTNQDDQPMTLQAHIVTWGFDGQKDIYTDSNDVMLNPPIAVIAPHQTQFIRLALRHPNAGGQESSYRLILEEVPPPPKPGFAGIQTVLKVSIPIFAMPKAAVSARLNWQAVRTTEGHLKLIATNQGNAHIQIKNLDATGTDAANGYLKGVLPTYLLPNQQREWLIHDERTRGASQIKVLGTTDVGAFDEIIEIQPQ